MKRNVIISFTLCLILFLTFIISSIVEVETINDVENEELSYDVLDNEVFIEDEVGEIRLYIQEEELDKMYSDPLAEEYIFVDKVIINGNEVENVGIRTKGNSSLGQVVNSDSERYSFKLSFDEYETDQDFLGLNQLILNNNFADPSYLREYLSYYLFREMGLPAPRASFAEIYINDELKGLYLVVEPVDENFVNLNFDDSEGDLYKPYMLDFGWQGDSIEDYGDMNLKTNEDSTDHSAFINLVDVINNEGDLEEVLNIDNILKYLAVTVGIVSLDSYPGAIPHNFYIYEESGQFSIIPWDFNQGFGGFSANMDRDQLVNYMIFDPTSGAMESRPLVDVIFQNQEYVDLYGEYMIELINGPMSYENMVKIIDDMSSLIAPYVERDPSKFYTYEQFLLSLESDQSIENAGERNSQDPMEGQNQNKGQGQASVKEQGQASSKGQEQASGKGQEQASGKGQEQGQIQQNNQNSGKGEGDLRPEDNIKNDDDAKNQQDNNNLKGGENAQEQNTISDNIIYGLKEFILDRINSIEGQLNGTIKSYNDGNGNGGQSRGADGQPR